MRRSDWWFQLEAYRTEIEIECISVTLPKCSELSDCADLTKRDANTCECGDFVFPACPPYECHDGSIRDEINCSCSEIPTPDTEWCLKRGTINKMLSRSDEWATEDEEYAIKMLRECSVNNLVDPFEVDP
jgi:hypothetical protein